MGKDTAAAEQHILCRGEGNSKFGCENMPLWLSLCINTTDMEICCEEYSLIVS